MQNDKNIPGKYANVSLFILELQPFVMECLFFFFLHILHFSEPSYANSRFISIQLLYNTTTWVSVIVHLFNVL
jgi:hypothetical protein